MSSGHNTFVACTIGTLSFSNVRLCGIERNILSVMKGTVSSDKSLLSTARKPPPSLSIYRQVSSTSRKRSRGEELHYVYDSSLKDRRTGRRKIGTGVPCGALSTSEMQDNASFLEVFRHEFSSLADFLETVSGSGSASISRIFKQRIAGIRLTVDQEPILEYVPRNNEGVSGNLNEVTITNQNCKTQVTKERLARLSRKFIFDSETGYAGIPGTFHRIQRLPFNNDSPNEIRIRLGREHADRECKAIVGDVCNKLWASRPAGDSCFTTARAHSLLVIGETSSGTTTMLREIARALSDPDGFFCKSVHLVDSIGELYGNQTEFSKNVKSVSNGLRQHEVIVEPKPYALCVDDICTGEEVESLEHISESGIVLVATVRASSVEDIINSKPTMRGLLGISAKDHSNTTSLMSRRSGICCFASALLLSSSQGARYRFIPNLNATIDDCLVSQTKNRN